MVYWIGYAFWKILGFLFYPITVHGSQNLPQRGSCILASNHASNMDPMLIGLCFWRPISYFAKDELFKNRFFAWILYHVGAFPVKRGSADIGAINEALRRLEAGIPLVIFPGGTRQSTHSKREVHSGIAFLAVKSGVPVVPVYIKDSDKLLPKGAKFLKRHSIGVTFGKSKVYSDNESYPTIANRIMDEISFLAPK